MQLCARYKEIYLKIHFTILKSLPQEYVIPLKKNQMVGVKGILYPWDNDLSIVECILKLIILHLEESCIPYL